MALLLLKGRVVPGAAHWRALASHESKMTAWDTIENLSLIENGLLHLRFELSRENPSYFRIAAVETILIGEKSYVSSSVSSSGMRVFVMIGECQGFHPPDVEQ